MNRSVVHSSYSQLPTTETISPDTRPPAIGIIVTVNYTTSQPSQAKHLVVEILTSAPRLTSLETGDTFETEIDGREMKFIECKVREEALEIEKRCRALSAELLRHAARMSEVAKRSKLVDDIPTNKSSTVESESSVGAVPTSIPGVSRSSSLPPSLLSKLSRRPS